MIQTEIERLISDLREAADSISSQSLSDIQIKLRKAANVLEKLSSDVEALEIVEEQFQEYYTKMTY
jgi:hypothetical protein